VAHASGSVDRRERRGQAALAVDTLWHTLAEDPSYERLPTAPYDAVHPAARAARVRELARWNDEPVRTRDEVLGLVDRAVSRTILQSMR
jgi:ribonuclease D